MSVIDEIAAERKRQISQEGWSFEHDDEHQRGELANAAACYAMTPDRRSKVVRLNSALERMLFNHVWPWSGEWWRPKTRRHDLVRAGALIVAEIERLDRAELQKTSGEP